jgi:hypothetical protein
VAVDCDGFSALRDVPVHEVDDGEHHGEWRGAHVDPGQVVDDDAGGVEDVGVVGEARVREDAVAAEGVLAGDLEVEDGADILGAHLSDDVVLGHEPGRGPLHRDDVVGDVCGVEALDGAGGRVPLLSGPVFVLAGLQGKGTVRAVFWTMHRWI